MARLAGEEGIRYLGRTHALMAWWPSSSPASRLTRDAQPKPSRQNASHGKEPRHVSVSIAERLRGGIRQQPTRWRSLFVHLRMTAGKQIGLLSPTPLSVTTRSSNLVFDGDVSEPGGREFGPMQPRSLILCRPIRGRGLRLNLASPRNTEPNVNATQGETGCEFFTTDGCYAIFFGTVPFWGSSY
ncbi:uncharacterized protein LY79DRAFT_78964 [Colletotrichum navitas]|uniref:Uncharacterized protein n=1 Tax=Colletotrichum navitas TaxID=681940 RepID=A0AAD8Q585_9PEZI|nr:uncharacterized protein LY79DRAFT_78964 [Colletotrichum navitas]KAK1596093.1 hypothetical protein LY79DRAFT_78964 [Colletotrichum navitas]